MDLFLALIPPVVETMQTTAQEQTTFAITDNALKYVGAGVAMGLGAFGPALGIGYMVGRAMDALGRNPEAQPQIFQSMIIGVALTEAIGIYALVTAIMIGFVF